MYVQYFYELTHWGRVTHICVGNLTIIGSDNGLSPGRRQAITWTNAGILLIGPLGTNFSEISINVLTFSFTKMRLKVSSAKWRPFCLGLNVLTHCDRVTHKCISELGSWLDQIMVWCLFGAKSLSEPMLILSVRLLKNIFQINFVRNKTVWCKKGYLKMSSVKWCSLNSMPSVTHLTLVPHICVSELGEHWFR